MKIFKKIDENNKYEITLCDENNDSFSIAYGGADLYWMVTDYHPNMKFTITEGDGLFYKQLIRLFHFIAKNDNPHKPTLRDNIFEWLSEASGLEDEAHKLVIIKEDKKFVIEFVRNPLNWSPISTCFISFCLSGSKNQAIANEFSRMFLEYRGLKNGLINSVKNIISVSIDEYREYLENYFVYGYDDKTIEKRKSVISRYSDNFLESIIKNTSEFCNFILAKLQKENNVHEGNVFTSIELSDEVLNISNGCIGGYSSDRLYLPYGFSSDYWISLHLLKQFLKGFTIEIREELMEEYDEGIGGGSIIYTASLFVKGPIEFLPNIEECKILTFKPVLDGQK